MTLRSFALAASLGVAQLSMSGCAAPGAQAVHDYPIETVPLAQVQITDQFWAPKMDVNRTVSIQHLFKKYEERGRGDNGRIIEAASYMLAARRDPELERRIDRMIDDAVAGVEKRLASPSATPLISGYFLEAAVAYKQATGKRKMLDAAIKAANAMDAAYGPGKKTYISGHQGLKIGLVALYRETGDARYWKLAQFFLDERGKDDYPRQGEYAIDRTYAQDHVPVVKQDAAVGHAVRATYMYMPLADIAALSQRPEYRNALDRIWEDAAYHKTYLTGAIGSIRFHEQFGAPYELPNLSAWNETCASYGYVLWNYRMFRLHSDARYLDVLERSLYNGFLAGVSQKGDRFFYQNPLTSYGNYERFEWIDTPCCPPNVVRLIASLGEYIYAKQADGSGLYVNLFVGSTARVPLGGTTVTVKQDTQYPWDGRVKIAIEPQAAAAFAVNVRVPGWTGAQVMPGSLYSFLDRRSSAGGVQFKVNGQPANAKIAGGFARFDRRWRAGDTIEMNIPMPVRRVLADARVRDDDGRVALARGPLVYAAEWPDNGGSALNIVVPDDAPLKAEFRANLLSGVEVVTGRVRAMARTPNGAAVQATPHDLVAIPYYAWANRGMGEMQVWLPRHESKARVSPVPLPPAIANVRSSGGVEKRWTGYNDQNDDLAAVYDGVDPLSSADESNLYFRLRPAVGTPGWIEYEFKAPTKISNAGVYWADDRRFCRLPTSWRIVYKDGAEWKPVQAVGAYAVAKDRFNSMTFAPVTTTAVRIEVEPATRHYKAGEIGPPGAMFLDKDIDWREFGVIEFRIR